MNAEQKDFLKYGEAWGQVVLTHKGIRSTVKALPGKTRQKLLRQARNETHQHELVLNAWQKRAVCRAWVHPMQRRCSNCKYEMSQYKWCTACANEGLPIYWEPRKEEDDEID